MYIKSNRIYTNDDVVAGYLKVEGSKIVEILGKDAAVEQYEDYSDYRIIPGIIDTHNHGTMGYSLMDLVPDYEKECKGYLKGLASQGVTGILPTADVNLFETLADLADQEVDGAKIIGIHSEGPYLNRVGEKGVDTGHPDIDLEFIKKMIEKGKGKLKLVDLAPELPNSDKAIEYLVSQGIKVGYAHSNCNYQEALDSFKKGISVCTHTANVMSGIHHREMGGLGACLLDKDVECEVICDGLHVSLEMLEIMFRVKPYNKFMLISDSTPMSGAPIGRYGMAGFEINITPEGFCLTDTGRLCGSSKTVLYGMSNLVEKMQIPLETVIKMASLNPATVYGVGNSKGSIEVGKDADFVAISDQYEPLYTYSEGRKVFDYATDKGLFNQAFIDNCKA